MSFVQKESPLNELWIVQVCWGDLDEGGHHKLAEEGKEHPAFLLSITWWTSVDSRTNVKNRRADLKSCSVEHQGSKRKQKDLEEMERTFRMDAAGQEEAAGRAREAERERSLEPSWVKGNSCLKS